VVWEWEEVREAGREGGRETGKEACTYVQKKTKPACIIPRKTAAKDCSYTFS
jgi:hypothetical protein